MLLKQHPKIWTSHTALLTWLSENGEYLQNKTKHTFHTVKESSGSIILWWGFSPTRFLFAQYKIPGSKLCINLSLSFTQNTLQVVHCSTWQHVEKFCRFQCCWYVQTSKVFPCFSAGHRGRSIPESDGPVCWSAVQPEQALLLAARRVAERSTAASGLPVVTHHHRAKGQLLPADPQVSNLEGYLHDYEMKSEGWATL